MMVGIEAGARMVGALGGGCAAVVLVTSMLARLAGRRPPVLVLRRAIEGRS